MAIFQKGHPKYGGIKKGQKHQRTEFTEKCLEANFDVFQQLISIIPKLRLDKQADTLLELMQYRYPKQKAVDMDSLMAGYLLGTVGDPATPEERLARMKARKAEMDAV